jgi:hypothetical protein
MTFFFEFVARRRTVPSSTSEPGKLAPDRLAGGEMSRNKVYAIFLAAATAVHALGCASLHDERARVVSMASEHLDCGGEPVNPQLDDEGPFGIGGLPVRTGRCASVVTTAAVVQRSSTPNSCASCTHCAEGSIRLHAQSLDPGRRRARGRLPEREFWGDA